MQAWICLRALFLMNKTKDRTSWVFSTWSVLGKQNVQAKRVYWRRFCKQYWVEQCGRETHVYINYFILILSEVSFSLHYILENINAFFNIRFLILLILWSFHIIHPHPTACLNNLSNPFCLRWQWYEMCINLNKWKVLNNDTLWKKCTAVTFYTLNII